MWGLGSQNESPKVVLTDPALVVLRFESRDWGVHSCNFRSVLELRSGLRELIPFAERWRLAIGDFADLSCCEEIQSFLQVSEREEMVGTTG